jgi:L-2-hydroxycarboxylate dehydrogenase (NAD+)
MIDMEPKVCHIETLREFSTRMFLHFGCPEEDTAQAADVLACADLRGIDSHGVARLYSYFEMLSLGRINPKPQVQPVRSTLTTATVDGDNGLGLVVGPKANRIAMDMAEKSGSGWVSVRNTNHFGIAGYYVLKALERDLIGWAMTNSTKLVAPFWGAERMLGTNPIAIGFPGKQEPPVVIDMATSAAAYGKIEMARRSGNPIPSGWAIDSEGVVTTKPRTPSFTMIRIPFSAAHVWLCGPFTLFCSVALRSHFAASLGQLFPSAFSLSWPSILPSPPISR